MKKTTRRQVLTAGALLGSAAALSSSPLLAGKNEKDQLPKLIHTVFFWLKNPDSDEDRAKLVEGIKSLAKIEQVRAIHVGVPASTEEREVIDNSYQVSETLFFDDVEGQDIYQAHPHHQKFIDEYSHLWSKVVVYDSIAV